ncbi:hypothetical protein CAPTEDRAFT_173843 [Capitella teleta]|uniref:Major facilitator superfamily (MFS) profile domain-containing protein n=1 Tax=Capitella teleta TaxID=283909 RepID=R7U4V4_CAPTE|nr:hypothetical protein CAPTEDRAFT_173843 [Capitella teleta]|eukprot:ELT98726.1 hypothetical protein CAPTEDRAFT_173843 [Capitella teleta]
MTKARRSLPVLDGGWGWVIVFSASLTQFIFGMICRGNGVFFLEFLDKFGGSATATSWVFALKMALWSGFGPIATMLSARFSCRSVACCGALLMFIGLLGTSVANHLGLAYMSMGLVLGIGLSFNTVPAIIITGEYFEKKKGVAMAIATIGSGIGAFASPPLIQFLFSFYGFMGALMLIAAIAGHSMVGALMLRPLEEHYGRKETQAPDEKEISSLDIDATKTTFCSRFDWALFREKSFLFFFLLSIMVAFCFGAGISFLPALAVQKGISPQNAAFLLSLFGVLDTVCIIPCGMLFDYRPLRTRPKRRITMFFLFTLLLTLSTGMLPLYTSYSWMVTWSLIRGIGSGVFMSQRLTVLADMLGKERAPRALGFQILSLSLGSMLSRTIGGLLKDYCNTYEPTFYIGGIGSSVLVIGFLIYHNFFNKELNVEKS